jgi:hypothetical protein
MHNGTLSKDPKPFVISRRVTQKIIYVVPYRRYDYRPYPTKYYNTRPILAIPQNTPTPVTPNTHLQEPVAQAIDKSLYVDSTDIGQNRGKAIQLSEKYKNAPQIISEKFQIYNVTKISNFRNETDKIMIESSSGNFAIPKKLITTASILHFTPELTTQLYPYLE